jgi:EmrB/QacA subfamily drug resistance transporter
MGSASSSGVRAPTNWLALFALGLATVTIANDTSAMNVALPTMERDFHTDINTIQWVINAYALVFGVMIVTGGRLADMFGRKRCFVVGALIFALFSVVGGAAPTETFVIVTRGLMGIGAALMLPAIIGMTYALLPAEKAGLAGGIIMGAAGLGNALGPLVGGFFTDVASWRWVFFANVPIALFAIVAISRSVHLPEAEDADHELDYAGIAAISVGLVALLIALDQVADWGWGDPRVIGLIVLSAVLLIAFVPIERRAGRHGLIPPAIIANRSFAASCLAILCLSGTFFATLLYLPQFMVIELDASPLEAGLGILPALITFAIVSFTAGPLYGRVGPKRLVTVGAACMCASSLLFSLIDEGSAYAALLPGMVLFGIGIGTFYATATTAGVTAVDQSQASLAGGIVYMFQIAGGSLGLGLTTTIFSGAAPPFIDGFQAGFRFDFVLGLIGVAISVLFVGGSLLGRRRAAAAA